MRTLHADLTTAQQSASTTPYLRLQFDSRTRATQRVYQTTDAINRIVWVQQTEGRWGTAGESIAVAGVDWPVTAIIRLADGDGVLTTLDWRGYRVHIGWGFNTVSGNRYSESPSCWVMIQRNLSREGVQVVELLCTDLNGLAQIIWTNRSTTSPKAWNGTKVKHILQDMFALSAVAACVLYNGATYTSYTVAAGDFTANDVNLTSNPPAVGDIAYFAQTLPFDRITADIGVANAGLTVIWEAWDGAAWSTVTVQQSNGSAAAWAQTGLRVLIFERPATWPTQNMNTTAYGGAGANAAFPNSSLYYIRARVTASAGGAQVKATSVFAALDWGVELLSGTQTGDDYTPVFQSDVPTPIMAVVQEALARTNLVLIQQRDYILAKTVTDSLGVPDYTYNASHPSILLSYEQHPVIPNTLITTEKAPAVGVTNTYPTTPGATTASDTPSNNALGAFPELIIDPSITSDALGLAVSQRVLTNLLRDATKGEFEATMNCGQEVWDSVQVVDARTGLTVNGRLSQVIRSAHAGSYATHCIMGGASRMSIAGADPATWLDILGTRVAPITPQDQRQQEIKQALGGQYDPDLFRELGL